MKREEREQLLRERLAEMKLPEEKLRQQGCRLIGGVDEVGRGPLAGPVTAACVVLPEDFSVLGVDDSKKLSEKRREALYDQILDQALAYGIGTRDSRVIDEINILEATKLAMTDAVLAAEEILGAPLDHVLIDALTISGLERPQTGIVRGDSTSISIAAASIVAKVTRDRLMVQYAEMYPGYAFEKNKGYGTKEHYRGLSERGMTEIHRRSFLKNFTE